MTQPVMLSFMTSPRGRHTSERSSDRFAEVTHRLQAGVDRGQDLGHGAGPQGDDLHTADDAAECLPDGPKVEDDPEQTERRGSDDQRSDDQGHPGDCWHIDVPLFFGSGQPRSFATEPAYRTAPVDTSRTVLSVTASI